MITLIKFNLFKSKMEMGQICSKTRKKSYNPPSLLKIGDLNKKLSFKHTLIVWVLIHRNLVVEKVL
jgi:hypothetical protein